MMAKTSDEIQIAQNKIADRIAGFDTSIAATVKSEADHEKGKRDHLQDAAKYVTEKDIDKRIRAKALADLHDGAIHEDQKTRAVFQKQRSAAQEELVDLGLKEKVQHARAMLAKSETIAEELSRGVERSAELTKDFVMELAATWADTRQFFGDDPAYTAQLDRSIRESVPKGLKAQLQKSFTPRGIILFDIRNLEGEDFVSIMKRPINNLLAALDSAIHSRSNTPVAGRATFRAKTVVSGLHGLSLQLGDTVNLEVNHPDVRQMVADGGLEQVSDDKAVSA
jgi:hypothetical protein